MKKNLNQTSALRSFSTAILFCLFFLTSCAGIKPVTGNNGQENVSPEVQAAFYALHGAEYLKNGDFNNAVSSFRKCVNAAPASEKSEYENLLGITYGTRGIFNLRNRNYDSAVSDLTSAVQLVPAPEKRSYEKALGMAYGLRGAHKAMNGYLNIGISDLETCLRYMPNDNDRKPFQEALGAIYVMRGAVKEYNGNNDGAAEDYLKFILHNLSAISN